MLVGRKKNWGPYRWRAGSAEPGRDSQSQTTRPKDARVCCMFGGLAVGPFLVAVRGEKTLVRRLAVVARASASAPDSTERCRHHQPSQGWGSYFSNGT